MRPTKYIETLCGTAEALIDDLRKTLVEDRAVELGAPFAFRGQRDSVWALAPSAFRPGAILGYQNRQLMRRATDGPKSTCDQGNAEWVALIEFLKLADEVGLDLPAAHHWLSQSNPFTGERGCGLVCRPRNDRAGSGKPPPSGARSRDGPQTEQSTSGFAEGIILALAWPEPEDFHRV
jgi:hypothetical protein